MNAGMLVSAFTSLHPILTTSSTACNVKKFGLQSFRRVDAPRLVAPNLSMSLKPSDSIQTRFYGFHLWICRLSSENIFGIRCAVSQQGEDCCYGYNGYFCAHVRISRRCSCCEIGWPGFGKFQRICSNQNIFGWRRLQPCIELWAVVWWRHGHSGPVALSHRCVPLRLLTVWAFSVWPLPPSNYGTVALRHHHHWRGGVHGLFLVQGNRGPEARHHRRWAQILACARLRATRALSK